MKIIKDLHEFPYIKNAVITMGSFDGVHLGHQKIIKEVCDMAKEINGSSVLITYVPHPRIVFNKGNKNFELLTSVAEKETYIAELGVDYLVEIPFNEAFLSLSAQSFIEDYLVKYFDPRYIIIGYDHRFGKDREGDINVLKSFENKHNFQVIEITAKRIEENTVSSTLIRQSLNMGDIKNAIRLLNHPYKFTGRVVHGDKMGRQIGFPTANILVEDEHKLVPPNGIYAVYVYIDNQKYKGMLYIGHKPTFKSNEVKYIEVNIFGLNEDIYDKIISVDLICYLRDDKKFPSVDLLIEALKKDKINTLEALNSYKLKQGAFRSQN